MHLPQLHVAGPLALIAVGPAASGKSTVLNALISRGVVDEVVSTDAIRAELGLAPAETATAYAVADARLRGGLEAGKVVAVDSTNVTRAARERLAEVVGPYARVAMRVGGGLSIEELVRRDAGRDRHVPVHALVQKLREFESQSRVRDLRAEGFVEVLMPETADRLVRCHGCTCSGATVITAPAHAEPAVA